MIRMRITKREPLPKWARIVIPIAAIVITLILSAIPILFAGGHLWKSYFYLFYGALGTRFNLLETFVKASPLLLTGLAVAFAFRAKFWNIGAEGQLLAGALTATVLGVSLDGIPGILVLPVILIGGFLAGGIWAAIPAISWGASSAARLASVSARSKSPALRYISPRTWYPIAESGCDWISSPTAARASFSSP